MVAIARSSASTRIQQILLATTHHLGVDIQSAPTLLAQMHPLSCFRLDLLIHFLTVPTGIFNSLATSWTLRVPRCLALLRACSWNSVECRFVVMNSAPMRIIRNLGGAATSVVV